MIILKITHQTIIINIFINLMKYINNNIINYIALILIIILIFNCYYEQNTSVQKYLPIIFKNKNNLKKKYINFLSKNKQIIQKNKIIYIENFLDKAFYKYLINQLNCKKFKSNNMIFRKGSGVSFYDLHTNYNGFIELYHSYELNEFVQNQLGKVMNKPSLNDKSCCSLLIYTSKGDFIDWHYDYSSYYGDRYTILLTLINENKDKSDLSSNKFIYLDNGKKMEIKCKPNSLIIFNGSNIKHMSTPIDSNEKRVLLSMTFCDICQQKTNIFNSIYDKIKEFVIY